MNREVVLDGEGLGFVNEEDTPEGLKQNAIVVKRVVEWIEKRYGDKAKEFLFNAMGTGIALGVAAYLQENGDLYNSTSVAGDILEMQSLDSMISSVRELKSGDGG